MPYLQMAGEKREIAPSASRHDQTDEEISAAAAAIALSGAN
jgi:hypothetical protein